VGSAVVSAVGDATSNVFTKSFNLVINVTQTHRDLMLSQQPEESFGVQILAVLYRPHMFINDLVLDDVLLQHDR
jgi:hypothetical protein